MPWLGKPSDLARVSRAFGVERVMIASPDVAPKLTELIREANYANLKVTLLPSAMDVLGPATEVDDVGGLTVLGVNPAQFSRSSQLLKRVLDVSLSAAAIVVLLPLLPLVALAIKFDSRGLCSSGSSAWAVEGASSSSSSSERWSGMPRRT